MSVLLRARPAGRRTSGRIARARRAPAAAAPLAVARSLPHHGSDRTPIRNQPPGGRAMDYGVVMFPTEYAMQPDDLARALEERGFESVWFPEHTHIPASRKSPWPGGAPLPREYWSAYDPFVALT